MTPDGRVARARAVSEFRCPRCHAPPGVQCSTESGLLHKERILLVTARSKAGKKAAYAPDRIDAGMGYEEANAIATAACPRCRAAPTAACDGGLTHHERVDLVRSAKPATHSRSAAVDQQPKTKRRRKKKRILKEPALRTPGTAPLKVQPYQRSKSSNSKRPRLKSNPQRSPRPSVNLRTGRKP